MAELSINQAINQAINQVSSSLQVGQTGQSGNILPSNPEGRILNEMGAQGVQPTPSSASGKSFSEILKDSVEQVNLYQHQADTAIKELVAGRSKNIHETLLTIERADTSLKLMMQVRNKILDAYKEIIRMQV